MPMIMSIGLILTVIGLAGLAYCMIKAYHARRTGLEGDDLAHQLRRLVAINLGSFFLSVIGLGVLVVGMLI